MEIQPVTQMPPQISDLEKEAVAEGFMFITRLNSEWHLGTNRFDAPGECLMAAYLDRQLVGVGGLSVDPFTHTCTGRVQRIYVTPKSREQMGRRLVSALLAQAALHFESVRLYTDTSEGCAFYLRCGFTRTQDAHATHVCS